VNRFFLSFLTAFLIFTSLAHAQYFQAGELDTTYNFGGVSHNFFENNGIAPGAGTNFTIRASSIQTDGKVMIVGDFSSYNGTLRNRVARLNSNGSLDTTFKPGVFNGLVISFVLQSNGRVLISGGFNNIDSISRGRIARLNSDGSVDTTFNPGTGANNWVVCLAVQSDGKVLIGGVFSDYNGALRERIARLHVNGSLDTTFDPGAGANGTINVIALQPNGQMLIGGGFTSYNGISRNGIARLNPNGSLDTTFNPGTGFAGGTGVNSLVLQPNGNIIIGGSFTTFNSRPSNYIVRLFVDGTLDTTFITGSGTNGIVESLALQSDGKVLLGGAFSSYNGTSRNRIVRLNANGMVDTTFIPESGANNTIEALALQSNGRVIIGGSFTSYQGTERNRIARLSADGRLDETFNPVTGANNAVHSLSPQVDGRVMIFGGFSSYGGKLRNQIARIRTDGALDTTFNPGIGPNGTINTLAIQNDGKYLIAGNFIQYGGISRGRIARINANGNLDLSFNSATGANNSVWAIQPQQNHKVIIGGSFTTCNGIARNRIARLNADGNIDYTFDPGTGANGAVSCLALQADGKVLLGGVFTSYNGISCNRLARLNVDGSLDTAFNASSGANGNVHNIVIQTNGQIIITGNFTSFNGISRNRIARLNVNGSLDVSFNPGIGANAAINYIVLQANGMMIIAGGFTSFNNISRKQLARLNVDGSLDTTFNPGTGANNNVLSLGLQPDGKLLIGGDFTSYNGIYRSRIARVFAPSCTTTVTNTTSIAAICPGSTKNLIGTAGGSWAIASGPGTITGNTYTATGGAGTVTVYNLVGSCYSPLVSFTVDTVPAVPQVAAAAICAGSTATLTPTAGGATYRFYADSTVTTPLPGGNGVASFTTPMLSSSTTYYITSVSAAGCESSRTAVTVNVHPLPVVNIIQLGDTLKADTAGGSFQWFRDGLVISGATSPNYIPSQSGLYRVALTNPQGCTGLSNEINVLFTGIDGQPNTSAPLWTSYPVPFREQLTIQAASPFSYQLLDVRGAVLRNGYSEVPQVTFLTGDLASGIYLLKITINGHTSVRRLVRE